VEPVVESVPAARPPAPAPRPVTRCERIVQIEVAKSERLLRARCASGAVVTMGIALGREPNGPKRKSGDLRTPEGLYRVSGAARPSRFHRFLAIDYPSVADAERALAEGRIDDRDHARILAAHEAFETPPADTPLGGAIGFHGEGPRWEGDSEDLDWTLGCIAVPDDDLDFLIARIEVGVPVRIRP
jgi:murein L,D-transpeptidase YafK